MKIQINSLELKKLISNYILSSCKTENIGLNLLFFFFLLPYIKEDHLDNIFKGKFFKRKKTGCFILSSGFILQRKENLPLVRIVTKSKFW